MIRKRPHRRNDCSISQKITIAYYLSTQQISDSEKIQLASNHPNLVRIDQAYYDKRYLFVFSDDSILGYDEANGFYVADTWGRRNVGKKPTIKDAHSRKVIFVP